MSRKGGTDLTVAPGLMTRATQAVRYVITGASEAWFGPQQPVQPIAQEAKGRQYDYPFGINLNYKPKIFEGVTFEDLRSLADNCDILRAVIETRKDQITALDWSIGFRDEDKQNDDEVNRIEGFFRFPDGNTSWETWLRALAEDHLVIDAATIYPRLTLGGDLLGLDIMDGATISLKMSPDGRTPRAPDVAYQQVLKGVPAVDYTADELIYRPQNVRTHRHYGYSRVEQIINTVILQIKVSTRQLSWFSDGTVPEGFINTPPGWTMEKLKDFQTYFNDLMSGNLAARSGAYFLPDGFGKYDSIKAAELKGEFDEWLARIICYTFSVPPTPFVKTMNRATAESVQDAARSEGLVPMKIWVSSLINYILAKYFKRPDLCHRWKDDEELDPLVAAQIRASDIAAKVITSNEARESIGLHPLTAEQQDELNPPAPTEGDPEMDGQKDPDKGDQPSQQTAKSEGLKKKALLSARSADVSRSLAPRTSPTLTSAMAALKFVFTDFLSAQAINMADQAADAYGKLHKADDDVPPEEEAKDITDLLEWAGWGELASQIKQMMTAIAKEGAQLGLNTLGINDNAVLQIAQSKAEELAAYRAAEMVGKKWIGGELVDNPDAKWVITDATRAALEKKIELAIKDGWSTDTLRKAIQEDPTFGKTRADMIARTEATNMAIQGNMAAWRASGIVWGKKWLIANDGCCAICETNAEAGPIPLDQPFPSGHDCPTAHPRCLCDISPVTEKP